MSHENIIRAWKDAEFRDNLSASDRALLPEYPAGIVEISDNDLKDVGGGGTVCGPTWIPCGNGGSTCKRN